MRYRRSYEQFGLDPANMGAIEAARPRRARSCLRQAPMRIGTIQLTNIAFRENASCANVARLQRSDYFCFWSLPKMSSSWEAIILLPIDRFMPPPKPATWSVDVWLT